MGIDTYIHIYIYRHVDTLSVWSRATCAVQEMFHVTCGNPLANGSFSRCCSHSLHVLLDSFGVQNFMKYFFNDLESCKKYQKGTCCGWTLFREMIRNNLTCVTRSWKRGSRLAVDQIHDWLGWGTINQDQCSDRFDVPSSWRKL